jgi:hypothetical protein
VDQAHEQVNNLRAFRRLIEQRVLSVKNRLLQSPFAKDCYRSGPRPAAETT